ncbi:MAG: hypothetical protein P4L51_15695 [Puia sp.]|nr:hypothetical protein [Puia sp.]
MKKTILVFLLPLTICISARSQTYKVGDNIVSLGIGIGSSIGNYGGSTQSPGIAAQYERAIWEAGPGVISLGGYLGYKGYKYSGFDQGYSFSEKWNYTIIGARGAYHFTGIDVDNLDVYAGLMLSYNNLSYSYSDNSGTNLSGRGSYGSDLELSAFGGARYYFANGLGAYGEIGFGVAVLSLGLCYHF